MFYSPTCYHLNTWFESPRVKLYKNDLKGNRKYFEFKGASS